MAKVKGGVGKKFETLVFNELKTLQQLEKFFIHRFVDSHDAGHYVSPQPADFLLATARAGTVYLEVKSSEVYTTLSDAPFAMLRAQQFGKLRFLERAEQPIYCLFLSDVTKSVELWDLHNYLEPLSEKNHLDRSALVMVDTVENLGAMLKEVFL